MEQNNLDSARQILLQENSPVENETEQVIEVKPPPPSSPFRLLILFCICCLTFGSYWVFDTPGAIPTKLKDYFKEGHKTLSSSELLLFYSIYSWPNTVLALFGGMIVDRITGLRVGAITFCFFIISGQGLFALGIITRQYWVAFAGRFLFGLGGESLTVVQNSFTVKWFEGKYLALAFGVVVSFARIGSSVNFLITPTLAATGVPFAIMFGFGACCFSFIMCLILAFLDWIAGKNMAPPTTKATVKGPKPPLSKDEITLVLKQVGKIPTAAWALNFICMFFYVGVLTFNTVASQIMQKTGHKYDEKTATLFLAIPNFVSVFLSPTFGFMVDKQGRAMTWIAIASVMMIISMSAFLANAMEWTSIPPYVLMLWQGSGYALGASAIWPTLSNIVPEEICSTAYGMMTSIQNIGMAVFPLVIGTLQSSDLFKHHTKLKYVIPIFIFIACEGISLLLAIFLLGADKRLTGGRLNATHEQRKVLTEKTRVALEQTQSQTQLESATIRAKNTVEQLKRAAHEQNQLLVRDVSTNRMAYYQKLGVRMPPASRPSISYRSAFM